MNLNEIKTPGMKIIKQQSVTLTTGGVSVQSSAFSAQTKAILIRASGGPNVESKAHFDIGLNPVASGNSYFIVAFNIYSANNGLATESFFTHVNPGDKLAGRGPGGSDMTIHIIELGY